MGHRAGDGRKRPGGNRSGRGLHRKRAEILPSAVRGQGSGCRGIPPYLDGKPAVSPSRLGVELCRRRSHADAAACLPPRSQQAGTGPLHRACHPGLFAGGRAGTRAPPDENPAAQGQRRGVHAEQRRQPLYSGYDPGRAQSPALQCGYGTVRGGQRKTAPARRMRGKFPAGRNEG